MTLVGEPAPDFTVRSTAGGELTLSETLSSGPTIVIPFRGQWCSYCAEQLTTFSMLEYDLWRHHGASIVPVTGDPIPDLIEMRDRFNLRLQLHSDPELLVASAYSGIEDHPSHGQIPVSGTFIVDTDCIVRYEQIAQNASDRTYANFVRHFLNEGYEHPYRD